MGIEAAAFHTTMALGRWSKVARLKEAGLWRGDADTPHYGHGNDGENFLAMDMVMPQACAPAAAPLGDCKNDHHSITVCDRKVPFK